MRVLTYNIHGWRTVVGQANLRGVAEVIAFLSRIMTLEPGDIIATGTPAGVGSARTPPVYFKAGDRSVCSYESIGTLTNPVIGPTPTP